MKVLDEIPAVVAQLGVRLIGNQRVPISKGSPQQATTDINSTMLVQ